MKLKIIVPFYSEFNSLKSGLRALRGGDIEFDFQPVQGPCVHNNRNLGVNLGRSCKTYQPAVGDYTHILFLDSDIGFHPLHVHAALNHRAKVVSLPYLAHENDGTYQVGELDDNYTITKRYTAADKGSKHVTFTGGGFLLLETAVFPFITYPWFHHTAKTVGDESFSVGEDVVFSAKLKAAGIPILCDFDYPVYHRLKSMEDFDVNF